MKHEHKILALVLVLGLLSGFLVGQVITYHTIMEKLENHDYWSKFGVETFEQAVDLMTGQCNLTDGGE